MLLASVVRLFGAVLLWMLTLVVLVTAWGVAGGPTLSALLLVVQNAGVAAISAYDGARFERPSVGPSLLGPALWVPAAGLVADALGGSAGLDHTAVQVAQSPAAWAFAVCIAAPVGEELLFRGALWRIFGPLGHRRTWLGSSVLFALWHADPVVTLALLPVAFGLGAVRARHGLVAAIVAHGLHNGVGLLILLDLVPRPGPVVAGSLAALGTLALSSVALSAARRQA